jgi:hypothetical protein
MEEFLRKRAVEPSVRNVAEDEEAMADLERLGTMITPVTVVDGEELVVGFELDKLARVIRVERP